MTTDQLLTNAAFSIAPAVVATLLTLRLAAYAERGIWVPRILGIVSMTVIATPLWGKAIISPLTAGGWDAFPYAVIEQAPLVFLLCATGLPGLFWRRRRALGYLLSLAILGGVLLALLTIGPVATKGWTAAVMPSSAFVLLLANFFVFARAMERARGA